MTTLQGDIPEFDPRRYPRTYTVSHAMRRSVLVVGLLILVLGVTGGIYIGNRADDPIETRVIAGIFCLMFAALGLYLLLGVRKYQVTLGATYIEVCDFMRRRRLERGKILGCRHFASKSGLSRWVLVPKQGFSSKLQLSMFVQIDKDFSAWMLSLPDLGRDKQEEEERERADVIRTMNERGYDKHAQEKLRRAAKWVIGGAFALGLAILLIPDPNHVLIWTAVVLPWLAIAAVARFHPLYRFGGPKNNPFPDLSPTLFVPGLFLSFNVLSYVSTVDWHSTLVLTLVGAAAVVGAALYVDPWLRRNFGAAAVLALLCCGYGYGAGLKVNALLDRTTPTAFPVAVLSKHVSHGKTTTYYLGVPPWGPHQSGEDVTVSRWRYQITGIGDTVCILLRPGAFGVGWYVVASCEKGPSP